jgi:hypothetical protein
MKRRILLSTGLLVLLALCGQPATAADLTASALVGTWTLVAADVIHRDGGRGHDYGDKPKGLLMFDTQGHYSLQIYDSRVRTTLPAAARAAQRRSTRPMRWASAPISAHSRSTLPPGC